MAYPNPILTYLPLNGSLAGRDRITGSFTATGSGALRWQPAEGARVNYCINSRFESNTNGWVGNGAGVISRITDSRFVGGVACRVVASNSLTYNGITQTATLLSPFVDATQTTLTISFDILIESGKFSGLTLGCNVYTADGTYLGGLGSASAGTSALGVLERKTYTITLGGSHAAGTKFGMYLVNGTADATQFLISNIVVEYKTVVSATYFDGSYSGCAWVDPRTGSLGSAHASPSCNQLTAWIEEGTTNYISNPRAETVTTGWSTYTDRTLSRDATMAFIGSASYKIVANPTVGGQNYVMSNTSVTIGATGSATASAMVYIPSNWTGGDVTIDVRGFGLADGTTFGYADLGKKGQWQRISKTFTATSTSGAIHFTTMGGFPANQPLNFTNIQVENKAYATSICDGSLGTGYSWSGTAHASSSTRAVAVVYATIADRATTPDGSMLCKHMKTNMNYSQAPTALSLSALGGSVGDGYAIYYNGTNDVATADSIGAGAYASKFLGAIAFDTWRKAYMGWRTALIVGAMNNNALGATVSRNDPVNGVFQNTIFSVGAVDGSGGQSWGGSVGPVVIFNREITDTERSAYNARIDAFQDLWSLYDQSLGSMLQATPSEPVSLNRSNGPEVVFIP